MKIVEKDGQRYVFDEIRRKYLLLTPEEAVRQQVVHWMRGALAYPKACLSVEKGIHTSGGIRRYDLVVYAGAQPWMLVECKAPGVAIDQKVFDQIGGYNVELRVPFLFVTNGERHFILKIDLEAGNWEFLKDMPVHPSNAPA